MEISNNKLKESNSTKTGFSNSLLNQKLNYNNYNTNFIKNSRNSNRFSEFNNINNSNLITFNNNDNNNILFKSSDNYLINKNILNNNNNYYNDNNLNNRYSSEDNKTFKIKTEFNKENQNIFFSIVRDSQDCKIINDKNNIPLENIVNSF